MAGHARGFGATDGYAKWHTRNAQAVISKMVKIGNRKYFERWRRVEHPVLPEAFHQNKIALTIVVVRA